MLIQDLLFALRSFLRAPQFTLPAVIALALGIDATSAIFSIVRGVILEPMPYRDPERIVTIWERDGTIADQVGLSAGAAHGEGERPASAAAGLRADQQQRRQPA